jgi:hypothetical protein
MHWFWRAAIAVGLTGVYYAFNVVHPPLSDIHSTIGQKILAVLHACLDDEPTTPTVRTSRGPSPWPVWRFRVSKALAWGVPLALVALGTFGVLTKLVGPKTPGDGHTRCRKCSYILRGITEPRCPECGERI